MRLGLFAFLILSIFSCNKEEAGQPGGDGGGFSVPVVTAFAHTTQLAEKVPLVATLSANEQVEVVAEIDSTVLEIGFEEGARVEAGQILFKLDAVKLKATRDAAEADFKVAELNFERAKKLLADHTINKQNYDEAEARFLGNRARLEEARENLDDAEIFAPFSGYTAARNVSLGQYVTRGTILTTLVDVDPIKAEFYVPERYINELHEGQTVHFQSIAFGDRVFEGKVQFISPILRPSDRTLQVKALVANPKRDLKPGMFGNLELVVQTIPNALTIPEAAISFSTQGTTVYVVQEDNTVGIRPVEVGLRIAGEAQILSGLAEGEQVVVEGTQKIYPGAGVMVSRTMNGPETQAQN
ncbi:MAG: efflux RND transporter periplasmic adaptor subunit [Acidobacteria bacterium]|nr:efflux RND transporter periplasmic adaptor subunit [Acidobacteriota bacterium]